MGDQQPPKGVSGLSDEVAPAAIPLPKFTDAQQAATRVPKGAALTSISDLRVQID
jgi:hypothetical protein